ncbi:MAG: alpha/beta fold hydrolase [Chloroflexota bacterium]|nr:alpha/beta hydrolase [Dehalococcoidia bacterium]MDW8252937.1 alpha/beta fold hydrolase [Chloroflexota bacterium]
MTAYLSGTGGRIAYEVHGAGPWIVLAHGGGLDRRMWRPQIPALAARYRVVAFDFRGQGESDAPETGYGPDDLLDDLRAVIDGLGIDRLHLAGLSQGAAIAQLYAVAHPDRVKTLILAGGSVTPTPPDPAFVAHLMRLNALMEEGDATAVLRANLEGPLIAQSKGTPNWPLIEEIMLSQPLPQMRDPRRGTYPLPPVEAAARLREHPLPLLIVDGERDLPGILARGDYLLATVPGARRVILPNAGHLSNLDQPDLFNAALLAFLDEHERS